MKTWRIEDKYKECCHNESCDSFDTCIECWDEWAERNPPMTNADLIRAMTDEELAEMLTNETYRIAKPCFDAFGYELEKRVIYEKRLEWLKQPAEGEQ